MKKEIGMALGLLLCAHVARAEHAVGNGGNLVVCDNGKMELLDFYEYREFHGLNETLGTIPGSYQDKVLGAIGRIEAVDPQRANRYRGFANTFEKEAQRVSGIELTPINDWGYIPYFPSHCHVEQTVVQGPDLLPSGKRYLVNQDLWLLLDDDQRAGLELHEIIYRDAIARGQETSENVREFNANLASGQLPTMSAGTYAAFLSRLDFDIYKYHDDTANVTYWSNLIIGIWDDHHCQRAFLADLTNNSGLKQSAMAKNLSGSFWTRDFGTTGTEYVLYGEIEIPAFHPNSQLVRIDKKPYGEFPELCVRSGN